MAANAFARIVIAGAASLRGKELAEALGDSSLAAADVRLLDEEVVAGRLAAAAGEAAVIQSYSDDSFEDASVVFFAGSPAFTCANIERAIAARARVIDMSGAVGSRAGAVTWIPALDSILPSHLWSDGEARRNAQVFSSPDAGALVAASLAAAFTEWPGAKLSITLLRPVSERGQEAVEELEGQTVKLLSFQPLPKEVFDSQIAFNLCDRYGDASAEKLPDVQTETARSIRAALPSGVEPPAVQIIQAPVFFGYAFSAFAEFDSAPDLTVIGSQLIAAGFQIRRDEEEAPSNVNAAGEVKPLLARLQRDANRANGVWLWGAVDNVRLAAANALAIAEKVLAS
jgi:aspartate-semialdehyde dehydrogenase